MIEVIIGKAHSGKSQACLEQFCKDLKQNKKPVWIVPHRNLARTLRLRVLQKVKAVSDLTILTLDDFARMIYREFHPSNEILSDFLRYLILTELLKQTQDPALKVFKQKKESSRSIALAIDDLKENLLWPAQAPPVFAKEVEAALKKEGAVDRKRMNSQAMRDLNAHPNYCREAGFGRIFLYGFNSFSPLQWKLVQALAKQTDLWISLTAGTDQPELFAESLQTLKQLQTLKLNPVSTLPEKKTTAVNEVLSFSNYDSELEWIARECYRLNQEEGIPFHEIAVITGAGGETWAWAKQIFNRYGIDLQTYSPEPLKKYLPLNKDELKPILECQPALASQTFSALTKYQEYLTLADSASHLNRHVEEVLSQIDFRPLPLKTSAVHFYGYEASPLEEYKVVFLSHFLEGSVPKPIPTNLFLKEPLIDEKMHSDKERLKFYEAVTRASQKFLICLSKKNAGGHEALPSLYLKKWSQFFPKSQLPEIKSVGFVTPKLDAALPDIVAEPMTRFFKQQLESRLKDKEILKQIKKGLETRASITRMEQFGKCHFKHFAQNLLYLQEIRENTWHRERGTLAHNILADLGDHLCSVNLEPLLKEKDALVDKEFEKLDFPFSDAEKELEKKRFKKLLEIFLIRETERLKKRGDVPKYFEKPFGGEAGENYKLKVSEDLELSLKGRIDRIDATSDGDGAIVIDYKSGSLPPPKKMGEGTNLQIAFYLDVCQKILGLNPKEGYYLSLKEKSPSGIKEKDLEFRLEQMRDHLKEHAKKLVQGSILAQADSEECDLCSFRTICRTEEEVKG